MEHITRQHGAFGKFCCCTITGKSMQIDADLCCVFRLNLLRGKSCDHSGKYIAAAALAHTGIAVCVDARVVGDGYDRSGAF